MKPGDKVTVSVHPLKSGGPGGALQAHAAAATVAGRQTAGVSRQIFGIWRMRFDTASPKGRITVLHEYQTQQRRIYLDENAGLHGPKLRVIERYHLQHANLLVIDTTVENRDMLTAPWQYSRLYDRTTEELIEYECNENPRNPMNPDGSVGYTFRKTMP
jgi:hypothetical protein